MGIHGGKSRKIELMQNEHFWGEIFQIMPKNFSKKRIGANPCSTSFNQGLNKFQVKKAD